MTRTFLILGLQLLSHGPNLAYVGIVVFLMLTGAGLPIPEEVFIIAAGAASAQGALNTWLALAACLGGALAGDCILYWIGYRFGSRVVREHHWWTRFVHPEREAAMERMIHNHGLKVLFLARFLVGIRAPVYLSAGVLHVPFRRFLLFDLLCASTVIGTFFGLSYFLSARFGEAIINSWIHSAEIWLTIVVIVAVVGIFFWYRHRKLAAAGSKTPENHDRRPCQAEQRAVADDSVRDGEAHGPVDAETASRHA